MTITDIKETIIAVIPNEKGSASYFITESFEGYTINTLSVGCASTGAGVNIFSNLNGNVTDFIKRKPKSFFSNFKSFILG